MALGTLTSNHPLASPTAITAAADPQAAAIPKAQATQNLHEVKDVRALCHATATAVPNCGAGLPGDPVLGLVRSKPEG
ncbi:hypothetical protein StoSoilB22_06310 [Arthrobacter sp. StoSoilB22]|nr:hypothetical protein StoSoilB22_06310 [Arthrobacter sp. StoSoilB22]